MAHAWWRDVDYELFDRLTRERDEAQAEVERWAQVGRLASHAREVVTRERDEAVRLSQLHWEDWDRAERELVIERAKRCGTCADWQPREAIGGGESELGPCESPLSECAGAAWWSRDHSCPHFRAKKENKNG